MMVMNIELTELGRHEAWLHLSNILKAGDKQIQLERKLASELINNWSELYDYVLSELFRQLPSEISTEAIEIITQRLSDALGQSFGGSQKVREEFRKYITRAYESGKSEFVTDCKLSLPDLRAIDVLTKHNCYWLGEHYGKHIGPKIAELTQEALREGLGRDELAKELRESLGGKVGGYKYWDVVSSAALVRSRSFGCISGMVEAGITEYEILAMGDERMCPICGEMNGQTFSVRETQRVINHALSVDDPDKFKEAMPWHTHSPAGMSKGKLLAEGMNIPPFHGRCRCTLIMSETVEVSEVNDTEAKVNSLIEQDEKYQAEYDMIQQEKEAAIQRRDVDTYDRLFKQEQKLIEDWRKIGEELRAAKIEAAEKSIMFARGIAEKLDEADMKQIISLLESAPEDVRKVWNIYEDQMKITDTLEHNAFYSPSDGGIHINIYTDTQAAKFRPAYSVVFHELGHLIDNKADGLQYCSQRSSYGLFDTLKAEVTDYINARQKQMNAEAIREGKSTKDIKKKDAYSSIEYEITHLPRGASITVSDLFSGATFNKVQDGWRHETEYWKANPDFICVEFFAQVFSDLIVNPDGTEMTKRYAPKSYAIVRQMISDMAK